MSRIYTKIPLRIRFLANMKKLLQLLALAVVVVGCKGVDVSPDNAWKHTPGNAQYERYQKDKREHPEWYQ